MIQQKLKNAEYDGVEQMSSDVQLIVSNAKAVYGVSICGHTYHLVLYFVSRIEC